MATDLIPLNFPFGSLDERTDSKVLPRPMLKRVHNFTRARNGAYIKRFGATKFSRQDLSENVLVPGLLRSDNTELVSFTDTDASGANNGVNSLLAGPGKWSQIDEGFKITLDKRLPVVRDAQRDLYDASVAYNGGFLLYAWVHTVSGGNNQIRIKVIEKATGAVVLQETQVDSGSVVARQPKCIAVDTTLMVFWSEGSDSTSDINVCVIDTAANPSAYTVAHPVVGQVDCASSASRQAFDVCAIPGTLYYVLTYIVTGRALLVVSVQDIAHAVVHTTTDTPSGNVYSLAVDASATHIHLLYSSDTPTVRSRRYAVTLGATGVGATLDTTDAVYELGICESADASYSCAIWQTGTNSSKWCVIHNGNSASVNGVAAYLGAQSKPFKIGAEVFVVGVQYNPTESQEVLYVMRLTNSNTSGYESVVPMVHMRFASGETARPESKRNPMNALADLGNGQLFYVAPIIYAINGPITSTDKGNTVIAVDEFRFDTADERRYAPIVQGKTRLFGGGMVSQFDSARLVELGFSRFPVVALSAAAGTNMVAGTYQYCAVWEWHDSDGNRHQSQPSVAQSITISGGNRAVNVSVTSPPLTRKVSFRHDIHNPVAVIYRTIVGGSDFYRLEGSGVTPFTAMEANAPTTYADTFSDATAALSQRELLYTTGGILPNVPPPPSRALCEWENRVFGINDEYPDKLWHTAERILGQGLAWSYSYEVSIPSGGPCVALAPQDRLLIFKEFSIFALSGDGPDRLGNGSFYPPAEISRGIGCTEARSVVTDASSNVYFRSHRGIEVLQQGSISPELIGDPIFSTLAAYPTIISADHFPVDNEVRFLCQTAAGDNWIWLIWSTRTKEWMTENSSAIGGVAQSQCMWQNKLVYTDGIDVWKRDITRYDDDGDATMEAAIIETGDVRLDLVGRVAVPEIYVLGQYYGDCNLVCEASYDGGYTYYENRAIPVLSTDWHVGENVQLKWEPRIAEPPTGTIRFRFTVSGASVANSGGMSLSGATLMVRNMGKGPLLGAAARG